MLKADILNNIYSQNNTVNFSFSVNVNEQRITTFLTEKCSYLNLRNKVRTHLR